MQSVEAALGLRNTATAQRKTTCALFSRFCLCTVTTRPEESDAELERVMITSLLRE